MPQITTIHNLSSLETSEINSEAEFVVNNSHDTIVRANKVTLSQIKSGLANTDLTNLSTTGNATINSKANTALSNLTDAGNIIAAKASMPSITYDEPVFGASGTEYTSPSDGWWFLQVALDDTLRYVVMENTTKGYQTSSCPSGTNAAVLFMPVSSGDKLTIYFNTTGAVSKFRFYYAVGSTSDAH